MKLLSFVFLLILNIANASEVPGYRNGRCRILEPDSYDRSDIRCQKRPSYSILFDGYFHSINALCTTLEEAAVELKKLEVCNKVPAFGICSIQYPNSFNSSDERCKDYRWTFMLYDGRSATDKCYDSVTEAMAAMESSPACASF